MLETAIRTGALNINIHTNGNAKFSSELVTRRSAKTITAIDKITIDEIT